MSNRNRRRVLRSVQPPAISTVQPSEAPLGVVASGNPMETLKQMYVAELQALNARFDMKIRPDLQVDRLEGKDGPVFQQTPVIVYSIGPNWDRSLLETPESEN